MRKQKYLSLLAMKLCIGLTSSQIVLADQNDQTNEIEQLVTQHTESGEIDEKENESKLITDTTSSTDISIEEDSLSKLNEDPSQIIDTSQVSENDESENNEEKHETFEKTENKSPASVIIESGSVVDKELELSVENTHRATWGVEYNPSFVAEGISARVGDVLTHRLTSLSTKSETSVYTNQVIEYYTENRFKNTEILDITVPFITAKDKDGNPFRYVNVYTMVIYSKGRDYIIEPVKMSVASDSFTLTRDQIVAWADENNDGSVPNSIYFLIEANNTEEIAGYGESVSEMTFHEDIVYRQTLVDETPYMDEKPFTYLQVKTSVNNGSINHGEDLYVNSFVYPETSDVILNHDKSKNYVAGDTIDIDITFRNDSKVPNGLHLLLASEGLELIEPDTNANLLWSLTDQGYRAKLLDDAGANAILMPGVSVTYTQKFKILDDYNEESIIIKPGLTSGYIGTDWQFDDSEIIELYKEKFTVDFIANGGTDVDPITDISENSSLVAPETMRAGYTLLGWYTDPELTSIWDFENDLVTKNLTLYASWSKDSLNYSVDFVVNGGSDVAQLTSVVEGSLISEPNSHREGHTLLGWYTDAKLTNKWDFNKDQVTDNLTLYASWSVDRVYYGVDFEANGGSEVVSLNNVLEGTLISKAETIRTGYTFVGWFTDAELTKEWNFEVDTVQKNMTLFASWSKDINKYNVIFETNGGSLVETLTGINDGSLLSVPETTRKGYTLVGWYTDSLLSQKWDFSKDSINSNMKLYASWELDKEAEKPLKPITPEKPANPGKPVTPEKPAEVGNGNSNDNSNNHLPATGVANSEIIKFAIILNVAGFLLIVLKSIRETN